MRTIEFIKWKWRQTTVSDYFYWCGLIFIIVGFTLQDPHKTYAIIAGLAIWLIAMVKFFIVEQIKRDYNRFIEERKNLLNTIKNSEK